MISTIVYKEGVETIDTIQTLFDKWTKYNPEWDFV